MKAPAGKIVVMADVARATGVTQATVSMALRDDPKISAATRRRVRAAATRLGYRPNPMMSALAAHRSGSRPAGDHGKLAVLNAWTAEGEAMPVYFRGQLAGMKSRASDLGYETEVFDVPAERALQRRLGRALLARGIRGVIVGPLPRGRRELHLDWSQFAVAGVGHSILSPKLNTVAGDPSQILDMLHEHLAAQGYRRIGYCNHWRSEERNRHLWLGGHLRRAFLAMGPDAPPPLMFESGETPDVAGWVSRHRLDAVIAGDHRFVIARLREAGLRVPRDIGVATVVGQAAGVREPVAGPADMSREIGAAAVDVVHGALMTGRWGAPERRRVLLLESSWSPGTTVRAKAPGSGTKRR